MHDVMNSIIDQCFRSKSRKAKRTHKNRKQFTNFMFSSARCSLLRAEGEGFSCSMDFLYGGLGRSYFFQFLVIKPWSGSGCRFGLVLSLKCWIQIQTLVFMEKKFHTDNIYFSLGLHEWVLCTMRRFHLSSLIFASGHFDFPVPEIIDPVFTKTSPKRSFSVIQNERFGLVFVKTGSINSGTAVLRIRRHGFTDPDPDPHQNVMDPQHCFPGSGFRIDRPNWKRIRIR